MIELIDKLKSRTAEGKVCDYAEVDGAPEIQAVDMTTITLAAGYYQHTGETTETYTKGMMYYYDGAKLKPLDGSSTGGGTTTTTATAVKVTLLASGWNESKRQTIEGLDLTGNENIIVSPKGSPSVYVEAGIYCVSIGNGWLIFECDIVPTTDIEVNVLIL